MANFRIEIFHEPTQVEHAVKRLGSQNLGHFGPWETVVRETLREVMVGVKGGQLPIVGIGRKANNGELAAVSTKVVDPLRLEARALWRVVAPTHQGQGLSLSLHEKELDALRALQIRRVVSLGETVEGRKFLEGAGYIQKGGNRFELRL